MLLILDLTDNSIHRRHVDQVRFNQERTRSEKESIPSERPREKEEEPRPESKPKENSEEANSIEPNNETGPIDETDTKENRRRPARTRRHPVFLSCVRFGLLFHHETFV